MASGSETVAHEEWPPLWVFSAYPPTTAHGGGIILRKLLQDYPSDLLTIVSSDRDVRDLAAREDGGRLLPARHLTFGHWRSRIRGVARVVHQSNALRIPAIASAISRQVPEGAVLLTIPWGGRLGSELTVAAYMVHRLRGVPLVVYEPDEWGAGAAQAGAIFRSLERVFHPKIMARSSAVWAISDPMAEYFEAKFGVHAGVLPNCVDVDHYSRGRRGERAHADEFRLLFTGAVYSAQAGAIANVLEAIRSRPEENASVAIYTDKSAEDMASRGVRGPGLSIERPVPLEAMPELLGTADALLLPFSFDERERATVSTSLPSKTADYLASGVPVLVHAPPYATIARSAREGGWAEVVDEPSIPQLGEAIHRLATDMTLRRRLVANALRLARERYDLSPRRAEFLSSIREAAAGNLHRAARHKSSPPAFVGPAVPAEVQHPAGTAGPT